MFLTSKWKWEWLRFSEGLPPPPGPPLLGGFAPQPPLWRRARSQKHYVTVGMERSDVKRPSHSSRILSSSIRRFGAPLEPHTARRRECAPLLFFSAVVTREDRGKWWWLHWRPPPSVRLLPGRPFQPRQLNLSQPFHAFCYAVFWDLARRHRGV